MYAQNNLDNIVNEFFSFKNGEEGFFVEAGGSDPFEQNNTYILEKNGWTGLVVEPKTDFNPSYHSFRPKTILENFVLVDFDYEKDTIDGDFSYYMQGGIENTFEFPNWNPTPYKCCTLQSLFDKHNIREVHFLSLDTEGTEMNILKGIDFNRTFIHLIIMELHNINGVMTNFDCLTEDNFVKVYSYKQHEFYLNKNSKYFSNWTLTD